MKKILVTGGLGYLGSHTIVNLLQDGYNVVSIDNAIEKLNDVKNGIESIANKKFTNYAIDICNASDLNKVFETEKNIVGIIHFAAYKLVGESVKKPLYYYNNNLVGLINILSCAEKYAIENFIFSSSCTVYGNPKTTEVTEESEIAIAQSPYGFTKQMGEQIITDFAKTCNTHFTLLRYFNPVGAHPSIQIGELPIGKPQNLVPAITQFAKGIINELSVWGNDYPTPDGSCIRDYIHVCDIASAHTLALNHQPNNKNINNVNIFNLGTGKGTSVFELINTFEAVSGQKINYKLAPRRSGDVVAIYANAKKANEILNWHCQFTLADMLLTAWQWQNKITP
jgi:UDP-glucose 4-epimerase